MQAFCRISSLRTDFVRWARRSFPSLRTSDFRISCAVIYFQLNNFFPSNFACMEKELENSPHETLVMIQAESETVQVYESVRKILTLALESELTPETNLERFLFTKHKIGNY